MNEAILDDVRQQVDRFTQRVRTAFDPNRYPRLEDGVHFDADLEQIEKEFGVLKRLFHDYLVAAWAEESARTLAAVRQRSLTLADDPDHTS